MEIFVDDPLLVLNSDLDFSNLGMEPVEPPAYRGFPVRVSRRDTGTLFFNSRCFNGLEFRLSACALDCCRFPTICCSECCYEF